MFGISGFELIIIIAFALIIFGPEKLPQVARTVGNFTRMFKQAQQEMESVIRSEMYRAEGVSDVADGLGQTPTSKSTPSAAADASAPASGASGAASGASSASASSSAAGIWAMADDEEDEEDEE